MIIDDTVLNNEPTIPAVPNKGQGKEETVTLTKAEVDSLRRERDEARQSERYWAERARSGGRQEPQAEERSDVDAREFLEEDEAADGVQDDTPAKFVDEIASQGMAALEKRGLVSRKEAIRIATEAAVKVSRELIGRERQKITSDAQIMGEFPELKDQTSELFKETAKRYQRAATMDPGATKTPAALYLAAEAAREFLKAKAPTPKPRDEDREDEADRRHRADSQDGRSRGRSQADDDRDMLGPEAQQVMKAMGISEQEFRDSQKKMDGGRSRQGGRR